MSPIHPSLETKFSNHASKASKHLLSISHCLKPSRSTKAPAASIHRCFLIPEIFYLILSFVAQQPDGSPEDCEHTEDRLHSKRTLASVARTCRAFSGPALDLLWMRLDSLDPLIRVLPSCMWVKKRSRFVVRMFMGDKQWSTFRKYAVRVRFLRGPCCGISSSVERNVITTLAEFSGASLPLLPNLTELVWTESDTFSILNPAFPLIKYLVGPRLVTVSLFLVAWPVYTSVRALLTDLPNLSPNVTSFTAVPADLNDHSKDIRDIVSKWTNLRVLRTSAVSQAVMDELASKQTLNTLSIELHNCLTEAYVEKLPSSVHTFSLDGSDALHCIRYLHTLQGNPTHLRLSVGVDVTLASDMETLFQMLPMRFDTTQLQHLTISLRSSFRRVLPPHTSFSLTETLLTPLHAFSSLVTLDVDTFCAGALDDAAYARMATAWPELTSLKVGTADVSRMYPAASVGAVIAVLRACPCLETLHMPFDGSIPPPPPLPVDNAESVEEKEGHGGRLGTTLTLTAEPSPAARQPRPTRARSWGVVNPYITQIHVGDSPIRADTEELQGLARCLRSVMPQLARVQSRMPPLDMYDGGVRERWGTVQRLLVDSRDDIMDLSSDARYGYG